MKISGSGNLGSDFTLRYTPSGNAVADARFYMRSPRKDGEGWADDGHWITLEVWGKTAENSAKLLHKGNQLEIPAGSYRVDRWKDKETDEEHSKPVVSTNRIAIPLNSLESLSYRPKQSETSAGSGAPSQSSSAGDDGAPDPAGDHDEDEIPEERE